MTVIWYVVEMLMTMMLKNEGFQRQTVTTQSGNMMFYISYYKENKNKYHLTCQLTICQYNFYAESCEVFPHPSKTSAMGDPVFSPLPRHPSSKGSSFWSHEMLPRCSYHALFYLYERCKMEIQSRIFAYESMKSWFQGFGHWREYMATCRDLSRSRQIRGQDCYISSMCWPHDVFTPHEATDSE